MIFINLINNEMKNKLKIKVGVIVFIFTLALTNLGLSSNEGENVIGANGLFSVANACECQGESATYCLQGSFGWCMERSDCCGWNCSASWMGDCSGTFYF